MDWHWSVFEHAGDEGITLTWVLGEFRLHAYVNGTWWEPIELANDYELSSKVVPQNWIVA